EIARARAATHSTPDSGATIVASRTRTVPVTRTEVPSGVSVPSGGRSTSSRRTRRRSTSVRAPPNAAAATAPAAITIGPITGTLDLRRLVRVDDVRGLLARPDVERGGLRAAHRRPRSRRAWRRAYTQCASDGAPTTGACHAIRAWRGRAWPSGATRRTRATAFAATRTTAFATMVGAMRAAAFSAMHAAGF